MFILIVLWTIFWNHMDVFIVFGHSLELMVYYKPLRLFSISFCLTSSRRIEPLPNSSHPTGTTIFTNPERKKSYLIRAYFYLLKW